MWIGDRRSLINALRRQEVLLMMSNFRAARRLLRVALPQAATMA